jgi:hypothetical protein
MIDNKHLIIPLLKFPIPGDSFYFVQLLQRKKDHQGIRLGGSNNNSRTIKTYYITSVEKLEVQWEEMTKLAEVFNARICINLNPRSFEKAAFQTLQKMANQMMNKDFYNIRKSFDSVCGNYHAEMDKRWLIDIDKEDLPIYPEIKQYVEFLHNEIKSEKDYKILAEIPSKSGMHIITNPFNLDLFSKKFPTISIHKNNPTSLWVS